jgi:hypothetical protein
VNVWHLLRWQWEGYPRYHQSRANLLLHIVAVPLFLASNFAVVAALIARSWLAVAVATAAMVVSLALQGRGHRREAVAPEPFTSPADALSRIFLEQWITFPRFVFSGRWFRALRAAPNRRRWRAASALRYPVLTSRWTRRARSLNPR